MNAPAAAPALPSIQARLLRAMTGWLLAGSVALGLVVWQVAGHEVDELLDDTLRTAAAVLADEVLPRQLGPAASTPRPAANRHFAWQVVNAQGQVLLRSELAPQQAWHTQAQPGFSGLKDWRVFGQALAAPEQWLYVAQTRAERREARTEVVSGTLGAAVLIALLGYAWLRRAVRRELAPVQALGQQLAGFEPGNPSAPFGPATRAELQPVHQALDELSQRLALRLANEQAFAAHAAHALRTPLTGLDVQLAVAQGEAPEALKPRLRQARQAAARLQGVVAALLGLFRSGTEPQRQTVEVAELIERLPPPGLNVEVTPGLSLQADPDLLAAALLNLLDNARRHGADTVHVSPLPGLPTPGLHLQDNGRGLAAPQRQALQAALQAERYEDLPGLGLMLADRVARAHGGQARLPEVAAGFCVELRLAPELAPVN